MKRNKYIVVSVLFWVLFNGFIALASENTVKKTKPLQMSFKHIVKIEIEAERKSQSLESYFRRIEKLEEIAASCENSKKVKVHQSVWTIYMTVEQKKLSKMQAQAEADYLVYRINQEMVLPKVEVVSIKSKKTL